MTDKKPVIGITCGDINGIGPELIIKALSDSRMLELFTPLIFVNNKILNFYRKNIPEIHFNYSHIKDYSRISPKQINIWNCWEEDVTVTPGVLNEIGGKYAVKSLKEATAALKDGKIDALVTAPIHKKNVQSNEFNFTGHTPFFKQFFNAPDVVMMLVAENMRVALLSEHVPVKEIATHITREKILSKLNLINLSLKKDFGVVKPRIAVLGLNPHAGDMGLVGKEEEEIIRPALKEARQRDILCFGPYSADGFFAHAQYQRFDAVLAMYHDQGLIPFKSLAIGEGVNYTAGLPVIRTSPDHGTAFDIAGKGEADESSFRESIFKAIDIYAQRNNYADMYRNPLKRMSAALMRNAVDERIHED